VFLQVVVRVLAGGSMCAHGFCTGRSRTVICTVWHVHCACLMFIVLISIFMRITHSRFVVPFRCYKYGCFM